MKWKTPFVLIGLCAVMAVLGYAKEELIVSHSDTNRVQMEWTIGELNRSDQQIPSGTFVSLEIEGWGYTGEVGSPRLPAVREFLVMPYGAEASVRLKNPRFEVIELSSRIMPVQAPVAKVPGALEDAPFALNEAAYAGTRNCLERSIAFETLGFMRGYRMGLVELFPVNYNPGKGVLEVLTSATIEVTFTGGDMEETNAMMARYAAPGFDRMASQIFKNADAFQAAAGYSTRGGATGLLIIAHTNFVSSSSLADFVDYKGSLGFDVTLVDTATTGGTKNGILNYIKMAYNTWPIPPEYVILVGDTAQIGYWTGGGAGSPPTDLPYTQMRAGDYFPDLYLGRFSVTQTSQLDNLVNKILAMDAVNDKKAVFMASEDNWNISEGTHNYVISNHLSPDGFSSDKLYCHSYNAKTFDVTQSFNNGRTLGIYSGHGSTTSWADGPSFSQNNVKALTNTIYPIVLSFACNTGEYNYGECFAETWIRDDHGSTIFWGATVSSYWDEDDVLEKRLVDGWYDQGLERFAEMSDYGKHRLYQYLGNTSTARRYYEMYNIMGDPTVKVLDEQPGGEIANIGEGIASSMYGEPTFSAVGDPAPGGLGIQLNIDSVAPSAFGILFFGYTNSGGLPFKGGKFYPYPYEIYLPLFVNGSGALEVKTTIPSDVPNDTHIYMQIFFDDATGPMQVTATDCLHIWVY